MGTNEVKELKPELANDYFALFDDIYDNDPWLNFRENQGWGGCYCTFYDDPREEDVINALQDKRGENKSNRLKVIVSGKASGLLAYTGGKVVGWCNVAPRESYQNPRYLSQAAEGQNENVGSITCFIVLGGSRGLGVATLLLESACGLVKTWGYPTAEGYPRSPAAKNPAVDEIPPENLMFRGSLEMFKKSGFKVHRKFDRFLVVRKSL